MFTWTPRYEPYSADVLPVCTFTSVTASAIGRMLVCVVKFAAALMPSSVKLFCRARWPAPVKLLLPPRTPGVVPARLHTLRPAQRRLSDEALVERFGYGRVVRVEHDRLGHDRDRFAQVSDLQDGIPANHLVVAHVDARGLEGLEAGERHGDLVLAHAHELHVVLTLLVRDGFVFVLGADIYGGDGSARDDAAAAVRHRADDGGLRGQLGRGVGGEEYAESKGQQSKAHVCPPRNQWR